VAFSALQKVNACDTMGGVGGRVEICAVACSVEATLKGKIRKFVSAQLSV